MKKRLIILGGMLIVFSIAGAVFAASRNDIKNNLLEVQRNVRRVFKVIVSNEEPINVYVVNQATSTPSVEIPEPLSVEVTNFPDNDTLIYQQWEYFYQCHPNPTNEAEIRGFLNDRGAEGWEVVAAAGPNGLICEYYKRPRVDE